MASLYEIPGDQAGACRQQGERHSSLNFRRLVKSTFWDCRFCCICMTGKRLGSWTTVTGSLTSLIKLDLSSTEPDYHLQPGPKLHAINAYSTLQYITFILIYYTSYTTYTIFAMYDWTCLAALATLEIQHSMFHCLQSLRLLKASEWWDESSGRARSLLFWMETEESKRNKRNTVWLRVIPSLSLCFQLEEIEAEGKREIALSFSE